MTPNRNLTVLFFCQLICAGGAILMVTLGGIVGADLASNPALATLPLSMVVIGTAASTIPATMLMKAIGRRKGSAFAAVLAAAGAALAAYALYLGSFVGFTLAAGLLGMNNAFVQQYRFAAAESVPADKVGRAVSIVLLGSIGGAILGPELATRGRDWVTSTPYVGTMLAQSVLFLVAASVLLFLRDPSNHDSDGDATSGRPLAAIVRQPRFIVAVTGGLVGYGVMTLIMTATPLSMHVIEGFSLEQTAWVIRSHVIAMYAPSLLSALLIERLGLERMMATGVLIMILMVLIGMQGQEMLHYWLALVLLGVGWNLLYVGGTTLLTHTYRSAEKFKAQAVNEFSIFGTSASASLLAGTLIHYLGWTPLILGALPPLALMLAGLAWIRRAG